MTEPIVSPTTVVPCVRSLLNLDEEIAYAIFNENAPVEYKNNPQAFEEFCKKKKQPKSTVSMWTSFKNFMKTSKTTACKPLMTPLMSEYISRDALSTV